MYGYITLTAQLILPKHITALLADLRGDLQGATAVEYCLIAALIAGGIAGGIGVLADLVTGLFDMLSTRTQEVPVGED
ncbi:Flp family type IVb pilin [Kordiimonas sp.]|uniref:Flp family type IVb pilin n=1 Tax=Kordiimonas sp. TaxID=1970157 RepID=UPI003A94CCCD